MSSIVAIVGRPNVGKSTLFNRLVQRREAIVDSVSGVTRDRHYGKSEWNGKEFSVIDTGGYVVGSDDIFEGEIRKQVQLAIEEADIIIFVVDVEQGITPMDDEVAKILRQVKKPIIMAVNKVDNAMRDADAVEFYNLGLGGYHTISSINGSGTGELLDAVAEEIPFEEEEEQNELPRFAIVGRPNAGKSSFINALIGEDRNIVTNIAGTTRDSIDTKYNRFGFEFNLVDTAGIRKKSKVKEDLEFYSVMRAVRAIEHCDVAILVVDATRDFEGQDEKIFWLAEKNKKGVVILVNKWDLVEKETNTMRDFEAKIRQQISPFSDVPIVFTSVLTKQRIFKAIETAVEVFENRKRRIQTSKLNETMLEILEQNPPPAIKGKYIKIKYCMQLPTYTPQFAFFANLPQYVRDPYRRYLENQLRQHYNFNGVPIIIYFRQK
ncbi:ribosome biogenesis GTPase Der [Tenacibaculum finnmarkense genomovar finnmarkense]|uniref:GTPase Der n=1 Tax=Tenacibaculum finnmarkense genomovar finnmarkense TaxID=1458503 RepID=A0AAP1RG45_9FLAO|nr:ribosome biogenesis GTPase Der [Tenacibaculum finnmarkense]MBE7653181.1 ribosome biogenesis GTPase Der [Tenacibaculum finnmarkense genomovar finnmarkense]MBE7695449.1 ribosome biogenesis GTPase Der [Tenacibaculum finnmarkense genomovar finnmarkense]MCD8411965.1 ribosome biogenesis GTPase Der [Tenacibaculum finnmarkense genomovar ulcerans]MCD8416479.1 ribosome biogenesis GTPase Der [Tenacibaculum finnmarkense genomovar finnmarkense]MCD8427581.1 ribosome biogenesis GTPase Der [Tenacibaculum f